MISINDQPSPFTKTNKKTIVQQINFSYEYLKIADPYSFAIGLERHFRQSTHHRNRSKSPPKVHATSHHHFYPTGHATSHNHFGAIPVRQSRRFSSHHRHNDRQLDRGRSHDRQPDRGHDRHFRPKYYYSESESDIFHAGGGTRRSRSSPPNNRHATSHRAVDTGFGLFSAHDLHAANERRASRRDLADLRDQLFVRSTNDLLTRGGRARASGRDLLDRWEAAHCEKCNAHTLGNKHRHSVAHLHSGDEFFVPRGGRY